MEAGAVRAFLDTHAAVFLWSGEAQAFGKASRELLENSVLLVSPFVRLELAFLREVGRLVVPPDEILGGLVADCGVALSDDPLPAILEHAVRLSWTRDPFDRLLVATAALHQAPFISRDRRIQEHYERTVW